MSIVLMLSSPVLDKKFVREFLKAAPSACYGVDVGGR